MKCYRKQKQAFERFLIFVNIKISGKSTKIELNEEFIAMWREEQSLGTSWPLYIEKEMKSTKAWKDWNSWLRYPGNS